MRKSEIYCNGILSGILIEENRDKYIFRYEDAYFNDTKKTAISLTLPKTQQEYQSKFLFPFFSNMIAEGENRKVQTQFLKINDDDQFSLLMSTAEADTIGNITVRKIET